MKRYLLLTTLLMALLLTACGQTPSPQKQEPPAPPVQSAETPAPPADAALAPEGAAAAVEALPPAAVALKFMVEGVEETLEATRHEGSGYAIYIPAEGWRLDDRDRDDGVFQTVWESTVNDDVELSVLSFGTRTQEEARRWLLAEEDDFTFTETGSSGLSGHDAEDREQMEVRFHEGGGLFAVVWTYPEAAAEGFGPRLSAMADSFELG